MKQNPRSTKSLFKRVNDFPDQLYKQEEQPKIKFGEEQLDDRGLVKMRHLTKPVYLLKQYQKRINEDLKCIELPDCMLGGVVGCSNFVNASQHKDSRYFFTVDLKNFFGKISHTRVHKALINKGLSGERARYITKLTTVNNCLPQGAPTSTTLANIVFSDTASQLACFCKANKIVFTVFVDDLTFSSRNDFEHLNRQILKIIEDNRFLVNQDKIHYRRYHCEITGLFVSKGKISLPKNMLKPDAKPGTKAYVANIKKLIADNK